MISGAAVEAIGAPDRAAAILEALAGAGLRSSVILLLALAAALVLWRASAARRHLVWTVAAVAVLVVPIASAVGPEVGVPMPWLPWELAPAEPGLATQRMGAAGTASLLVPGQGIAGNGSRGASRHAVVAEGRAGVPDEPAAKPTASSTSDPDSLGRTPVGRPWHGLLPAGVLAWAVGALFLLGRLAVDVGRISRIRREALPLGEERVLVASRRVALRLGLDRLPVILGGDDTTMPMTWGVIRPHVLLPAGVEEWDRRRLEAVLAHELAHVVRRDCLTQLVARVACAVYWFHPLVWLAAHRMRVERELACDDLVVTAAGAETAGYARELVAIARSLRPARRLVAGLALVRSDRLRERLVALLEDGRDRRPPSRRRVAVTWTGAVVFALSLALLDPETGALEASQQGPEAVRERVPENRPRLVEPAQLNRVEPWGTGVPEAVRQEESTSAEGRIPSGGDAAVTATRENRTSDHARARDLLALLEEPIPSDVSPASAERIRRIVTTAGRTISSDHHLARVLTAALEHGVDLDPSTWRDVVRAAGTIQSDHHAARILAAAVERGALDRTTLELVLDQVREGIDTDHHAGRLLRGMATTYPLDRELRERFRRAAETLGTRHQKASVQRALETGPAS